MSHTPGPWVIEDQGADGLWLVAKDGDRSGYTAAPVALTSLDAGDATDEDLALICAAPDLLHALIEARRLLQFIPLSAVPSPFSRDISMCIIEAAIAKAEGRTPEKVLDTASEALGRFIEKGCPKKGE